MFNKSRKTPPKRSSEILMEIVHDKNLENHLTYRYILQALGDRAFGIVFLFFSLPSVLPFSIVPGVSLIFSLPIVIFAVEMIFARKSLWLPKIIANKTISHSKISKIIAAVVPYVIKLEHFSKPRWALMTCRTMEIINGITILCLALLLMLPIPFSNFIFGSLLAIFSLGIVEKDGILIFIAYLCFIMYIFFVCFFTLTIIGYFINNYA